MDPQQRLDLSKLIKEYNSEDTTDKIRELKHSSSIRQEVAYLESLKKKYSRLRYTNKEQFKTICQKQCNFLFNNYTNIFVRLINDELDLTILSKFLSILEQIENGEIDQHDGSYKIGSLLKELYIDSALKKENKRKEKAKEFKRVVNNISWNDFKNKNME
jgi:hypothetical protein